MKDQIQELGDKLKKARDRYHQAKLDYLAGTLTKKEWDDAADGLAAALNAYTEAKERND
jgi:hypothetical protein